MWIGIRITGYFRNGVQRPLRRRVIAQHPVALTDLFQRSDGIRLARSPVPHFLSFYEKCVPVVVVRVGAENPVMSLRGRECHLDFRRSTIHARVQKAKQNVALSSFLTRITPLAKRPV